MIPQSLLLGLLVLACQAPRNPYYLNPPTQPTISSVEPQIDGLLVKWQVTSFQPILYHTVIYTDPQGRTETFITKGGNDREALIQLVLPCQTYQITVTSTNAIASSVPSLPAAGTAMEIAQPLPPTQLAIEPSAEGNMVRWVAPVDSPFFSNYVLIGKQDDGEIVEQFAGHDQTDAQLTEFNAAHSYILTIVTENSCSRSIESEPVQVEKTILPGAPQIVRVVPQNKAIQLYFQPNLEGGRVEYYKFSYTTPFIDVAFRAKELPDQIVFSKYIEECTNHTFTVVAVNPVGESQPSSVTEMTLSEYIPAQPTDLITIEHDGTYYLKWSVSSPHETLNHQIDYEDQNGNKFMEWALGEARQVALHEIKQCHSYKIKVRSENQCGWSPYSAETTLELPPLGPPAMPASLRATGTANLLTIEWNQGLESEERLQYDLLLIGSLEGVRNFWVSPDATAFQLDGLDPSLSYTIILRSENKCGWSPEAQLIITFDENGNLPV